MLIGVVKQYLYPIIGIVLILVIGFATYKVYDFGYSRAEDKITAKYEAVISDINAKSAALLKRQIKEHNEFVELQDKLLNNLKEENKRLDDVVKENEIEASKDTTAKRPAISKSGSMRLNRIR